MEIKKATPTVAIATTITSGAIDIGDATTFSVYALFSGSDAAGTFKLQVGNDGTNFVDLSGSSSTISSAGDTCLNVTDAGYRYMRYSWVRSGGSGNITVTVCVKGELQKTRNRYGR